MNKLMQEHFDKLEFQPIETLKTLFSEPKQEWEDEDYVPELNLPAGIVLRRAPCDLLTNHPSFKYVLLGNDVSGSRTEGCSCCSMPWKEAIDDYDGWVSIFSDNFKGE